ncbi:hypothetical protein ACVB8X_02145 [Streptomyces sp. NRAIS4]
MQWTRIEPLLPDRAYIRLRMWAVDGAWERVFTALMAPADHGSCGEQIEATVHM